VVRKVKRLQEVRRLLRSVMRWAFRGRCCSSGSGTGRGRGCGSFSRRAVAPRVGGAWYCSTVCDPLLVRVVLLISTFGRFQRCRSRSGLALYFWR